MGRIRKKVLPARLQLATKSWKLAPLVMARLLYSLYNRSPSPKLLIRVVQQRALLRHLNRILDNLPRRTTLKE